jgi:hypothetical protein
MTASPAGGQEPVAPNPFPGAQEGTAPAKDSTDPAVLANKLALVMEDNRKKGETNAALNAKLLELQNQFALLTQQQQTAGTKQAEESGDYKTLWEQANKTAKTVSGELETVKKQLDTLQATAEQERIAAKAIAQIADAKVVNAEQLYTLLGSKIQKDSEGKPIVLHGGVEHDLKAYLETLRQPGSGFEHHFLASGQRGMGATGSVPPASESAAITNPYITSNLTQQIALETTNPSLAKTLEADAKRLKQAAPAA